MGDDSHISKLPLAGKKVVARVYSEMISKGFTKGDARNVAIQMGDSYGCKTSYATAPVQMETALVKDGFFNPSYYYDAVLSSTRTDSHNQVVSKSLLKYLDQNNLIDWEGDISHKGMRGEGAWKGLFRLASKSFDGSKLNIRFSLDKAHSKFKEFMSLNKKEPFNQLSAEFYAPKMMGNKIVFSNGMGWTLTSKGSNPDAIVKNRTRK